jgi:hypothetical protein
MKIDLITFGPIISDREIGDKIYNLINQNLLKGENVIVDFKDVKSMATYNAKQIFGQLYKDLGPETFFEKIGLQNTSDDLKVIIRMGIENELESKPE